MMDKFQKLALLIDAENIALDNLESVIRKISAYGRIVIQRAYGDWSKESLKNWKDSLNRFGIKAEQQFNYTPQKNSTDMALTIDALDLLYQSSYDALAIVSSDCDFTPVSLYVREHGIYVIGIGEKKTPEAFKKSCNEFILLKTADSKIDNTLQNKPSQSGSEKRKKIPESIHKLLKEAFETHKKEGWVALSRASSYIKNKQPDFSLKEYYSKFYKLIQYFPEKYKLEKSHTKYQCK